MKFYIDLATRRFVRGPASSIPLERLFLKRRDKVDVEIVFVEKSAIVPTAAGTSFSTGLKTAFSDTAFLALSDSTGLLDLYTTAIEALFADDPSSVSAYLEVKTSRPGEETRTSTLGVDIENSVILGDEGSPAAEVSLKATSADATAGVSNEKWMTPLRTAEAIAALGGGSGGAADWNTLTGKPATFPPSSHTHPISEITGLYGGGNISSNTAIGSSALAANSTGTQNTAIGPSALALSQGDANTAIGPGALSALQSGNNNTAIGISALLQFQSGSFLTAIGSGALGYFQSGNANTAIGNGAMLGLNAATRTHSNNTAMGDACMLKNDTGSGNTALGAFAMINNTSGSQNTAVGNGALADNVDFNNTSALGSGANVTGSNQVQLGNSATTTYTYGAVQNRSDSRDKTDIRDTALGLDFILALRPVDFRWDMREDYRTPPPPPPPLNASAEELAAHTVATNAWLESCKLSNINPDGTHRRQRYHHGLIAQEVREILTARGIDFGGFQDHSLKGGDDTLSIGYIELIAPLIKAVQELSAKLAALEAAS